MNKLLPFAALAFVVAAAVSVPKAEAAPKWQALIYAADGGSSIGYCVSAINQTVELQSQSGAQYCYKTCATSTCVADCTKDWNVLPDITSNDAGQGVFTKISQASGRIDLGADKCVAARALDAGNPALNLFLHTKNPPDDRR